MLVVELEAHADQVGSTEVLEDFFEAEELEAEELEDSQADQLEAAALLDEPPVFTAGVETAQTWVEVTVGLQLAGSTQLFQSPEVAEEEAEAEEEVGTFGLLELVVETTGLLLVVTVTLQSVTVEVFTTAVQVCLPSTVQHGLVV